MREKIQIGIGVVGVILLIAGGVVAIRQRKQDSGQVVVITEGPEGTEDTEVVVDVAGAVENPGVYKLAGFARVNDALVAAGGLAEGADRVWVARYLNLAQVVPDGAKIYIPRSGEENDKLQITNSKLGQTAGVTIGPSQPGMININTASASELDSLWGIGAKRAADIMANRPYGAGEELMTKAGIPKNVYEKIKDKITIF